MNRLDFTVLKHLLEIPVPATEAQCVIAVAKWRTRSLLRNTKMPLKVWRKSLALYLEHRWIAGMLPDFTHGHNGQRLGLSNQAMNRLRRRYDTLSNDQCSALRLFIHKVHGPKPTTPTTAEQIATDAFKRLLLETTALTH